MGGLPSYLTIGEKLRMELTPWTRPVFEGTARDRILKDLVSTEQLSGKFLNYNMTPQGARGIDLFTKDNRFGFDLTTSKSWSSHVSNYKGDYDIILPLLYR